MNRTTNPNQVVNIPFDIRIYVNTDTNERTIQEGHKFSLFRNKIEPNRNLDDFLLIINFDSILNSILNQIASGSFDKKSVRIFHAGNVFLLYFKAGDIVFDNIIEINVDVIEENQITLVDSDVNTQWQVVPWIKEIMDRSKEALVILDARKGNLVYCNEALIKLVNLDRSLLIGQHFTQLFTKQYDSSFFDRNKQQLFEKGSQTFNNVKLRNHASHNRDATVRTEILKIGQYKYVYATISENRITQDLINQSEYYHFKVLFDDALVGSLLIDLQGKIFDANHSFTLFSGYTKSRIYEHDIFSFSEELFEKRVGLDVKNAFDRSSKISNKEVLLQTKDKDWIWCRLSCSMVHDQDNTSLFFILTIENIHDVKTTELNYLNNRDHLIALSANLNECIYRSSMDEGIIFANNAFVEKFGYESFKEIENIDPSFFYSEVKEREEVLKEIIENGIIQGKEICFKRKDKSKFWGLMNCSIYTDASGRKFLDGVITDISNQKRAEKLLKKKNSELKKINKEMDKFVYSVSHDLRAPLMSILGLLKLSNDENKQEGLVDYLSLMEKSVMKLDTFIRDIIDFSRNARKAIDKEEINLEMLSNEVWKNLEYMVKSDEMEFNFVSNQTKVFKSDAKRLEMILSNLFGNAIRHHDYSRNSPIVNVEVSNDDNYLYLQVHDNGPGIPKEYQEKVFDMFFRISSSKNGSGLGLYIVKETINKLHGNIHIHSNPIQGTTFQMRFPFQV